MQILLLKWSDDIERPETKSFIHHMKSKVLDGQQVPSSYTPELNQMKTWAALH
jgi:hypothetical protein